MNEKLKVISKTPLCGRRNGLDDCQYLLCEMSDGSYWSCDMNGRDWRKEVATNEELTKRFNFEE